MKKFSNQSVWRTFLLFAFVTTHETLVFAQQWVMDDIAEDNVGGPFSGILGAILLLGFIWLLGVIFGGQKEDKPQKRTYHKGHTTEPVVNYMNEDDEEERKYTKVVPQAIDMGLSVKWASFNLGAYKPGDVGSLFYWAENVPSIARHPKLKDVNIDVIGEISGNEKYDAATNLLGSNWRLPTEKECQELLELCNWETKVIDGVEGSLVTGPNRNSIFLPYNQKSYTTGKYVSGHYWTSTPRHRSESAYDLRFGENCKQPADIWCATTSSSLFCIRPVFTTISKEMSDKQKQTETRNAYAQIKAKDSYSFDANIDYKKYQEQCLIREEEKDPDDFPVFGGISFAEDKIQRDEHGVIYSLDGKRLLDGSHCDCKSYEILEGTEFVCDDAFCEGIFESLTQRGRKRGLSNIILPSSLIYIPESAVPEMCQIESKSPNYRIINELLIDTRSRCVIKCLNKFIQKIVLYEPIEEIGDKAFMNCDVLQEVSLPNMLKRIGEKSFYNNKFLKKINLPNSIEIIGEDAFFGCDLLYINSLPQNLKSIGSSAFSWCNIQDSIIPEGILYIGNAPFPKNCNNLKSESKRFIISDGLLIDKIELSIVQFIDSSAKSVTIPQNVTKICPNAFHHCNIETIHIPSNIIEIGSFSFWGCKNLGKIVIDGHLHSIPTGTFDYCDSLTSINIPSGVEIIETGAFDHCKLLQDVKLNNDLNKISNCAFIECPSLTSLSIPESVEVIGDRNQYNQYLFRDCRNLHELYYDAKNADISGFPSCITKLAIGEHVEVLPASLLSYNSNIESFTIPTNVRKVSKACISNSPKLHEIVILSKSIILEEGWIRNCDNLAVIHIPKDSYDSLLPLLPVKEGLKINKIYDHHFLFFKW